MSKILVSLGALLVALISGLIVFTRTGGVSAPEFVALFLAALAGMFGARALTRRRTDATA